METLSATEITTVEKCVRESLKARWDNVTLRTDVVARLLEMAKASANDAANAAELRRLRRQVADLQENLGGNGD